MDAERYVRENYKSMTDKELSVVLNISARKVSSIRYKNGFLKIEKHYWSKEEKEWIKKNRPFYTIAELTDKYQKVFSQYISADKIKALCIRNGWAVNVHTNFTPEQDKWLIENVKKYKFEVLSEMFNKKFGQNKTQHALRSRCTKRLHLISGRQGFKKNCKAINELPIGYTRKKNGYTFIKISNTGIKNTDWITLQRKIYEDTYGKCPDASVVIFLDGDHNNFDIKNLYCISRKTNLRLNNYKWRESKEITKSGIKYCELCDAIKEQP